jgi:hypothetical protein
MGHGLVHFECEETKDLQKWFWNFLHETAHWVIRPSKIGISKKKIFLKLWLDRVDFIAKWVTCLFRLYDHESASSKYQELRIITDPLEIWGSNTVLFMNHRQVELVHLQLFSFLRILNRDFGFEDLILMFESNNTAFMTAVLESIEKENMDLVELDESLLNQIIKVNSNK